MDKAMALRPRLSEKSYAQSLERNVYVFNVPMTANKKTIADAVGAQFEVTVEDVRVIVVKGKTKQSYRKGRRPVAGKRADVKKAYVRVKDGQTINIFGDEGKKDEKPAKTDKTPEKKPEVKEVKQKQSTLGRALGRTQRQTQDRGGSK